MNKLTCEPWNNFYRLVDDLETLLDEIQTNPLTDHQVKVRCLTNMEIACLLDPGARICTVQTEEYGETTALVFLNTPLTPTNKPFFDKKKVEFLNQLNWNQLPRSLQETCNRRAQLLLTIAYKNHWVAFDENSKTWSITFEGSKVLDSGELYSHIGNETLESRDHE